MDEFLTIDKITLNINKTTVNALLFRPAPDKLNRNGFAIFSHGYTSHKGSIFVWAQKLCEDGLPCVVFDQPGHFSGSFNDIESFDAFKHDAPRLYKKALEQLESAYPYQDKKLLIGGHSLGALTSLQAIETGELNDYEINHCGVGFGVPPEGVTHVFDTKFYRATVHVRAQMVSEHLKPDIVFPWIKDQKFSMQITGTSIHLISGEDDVVVGKEGMENFAKILEGLGNTVTLYKPKKLGHHLPEQAGSYVKKYAKSLGLI